MTSWPEEPPAGQPQTRRQAREFERSASRRAGTAEPTPAGQIPEVTTNSPQRERPSEPTQEAAHGDPAADVEQPAIPASAFAEPGVSSPSSDVFDLFKQAPDVSQPEPVTQPMAILQPEPAPPAPAAAAAAAPARPQQPADQGRTLTRRELRAMQQAEQANGQAGHPAVAGEPVVPVTFTSEPEGGAASSPKPRPAVAPPPSIGTPPSASEGSAAVPAQSSGSTSTSEKSAWPFPPLVPSASRTSQPEATVTQSLTSPFAAFGAQPSPKTEAAAGPADPVSATADATDDVSTQERRPFTPPTGHWSTAAELDDGNEPITSRNVGQSTAATTTNALILPAIPHPDATAPLTSTGEILVTGSIDLPRGMGATGAHPDHLDSSDLVRLLDGEENEFNTSEVQPVRASRAISTHTSTRGVIAPPKKRGNTLPVVLMVTAGVLAIGVIGLLVAAYVLKVF
jgi:hypothetical protein